MNKYFFSLIAFSVFTNISLAQDMEEVVVTSSLVDTSEITNPLYIVDGDDISDDVTTSLGDAIDSYLGVSIADYGAAVGQPIIRGMSGPRVKILKNGMVNRDVSGLGVDHLNDVDLSDIDQIEIVKGPSSLLYANGTIGGIINVVDNTIATKDFESSKLDFGYETQSVNDGDSQHINAKDNINGFNVTFAYKNTELGNYDVPSGAVMHEEDHDEHEEEGHDEHEEDHDEHGEDLGYIDNSDFAVEATKFGVSKVGDWGYVGFSIDNLESLYGIPFHGDDHGDEEGHDEHEGEDDHDDHGDEEGHEEHAPTVFSNNATEYGAIFDISNDNITQKVVLNFVDEDSSIVGEEAFMNPANNEEFTLGYYMSKDLEAFSVDFGMRLDQIDRTGSVTDEDHGDIDYFNIDDSTNSFAVSLGRELSDSLNMSIGYASVERLPSVIELFMNGPHMATGRLETGNPNLQSETSNNFDITFNFESGEYYGYASFYVNDVDNYITLMDEDEDHDGHEDEHHDEDEHHEDEDDHADEHDDHGHGNLIHANYVQEDAEFDGYEIEFGRTMSLASGELTLSFGRDVVNAKFADGHNVPRINPARNVYSLSYKQDDIVFKLSMKDVDKQNDIGEGETATEAYQMLDTRLTKTFDLSGKSKLKVSLFGRNLLDEVARNHASFVKNEVPLPGRNYGIKFNLTY